MEFCPGYGTVRDVEAEVLQLAESRQGVQQSRAVCFHPALLVPHGVRNRGYRSKLHITFLLYYTTFQEALNERPNAS